MQSNRSTGRTRTERDDAPSISRPTNGTRISRPFLTLTLALLFASNSFAQSAPSSAPVPLTPEEARRTTVTLSECEAIADEVVSLREENRTLRAAVDAALAAAKSREAANTELQEVIRTQATLQKIADDKIAEERKNGKKRAIRWGTIGVAVGVVLATLAGN